MNSGDVVELLAFAHREKTHTHSRSTSILEAAFPVLKSIELEM